MNECGQGLEERRGEKRRFSLTAEVSVRERGREAEGDKKRGSVVTGPGD